MKPIYTMRYRPVSSFTLPQGISTEWVRIPQIDGLVIATAFPELERSKHPYGEFTASRELTDKEMDRYQVQRVDLEHLRAERVADLEQRIDTLRTERTLFATDPDEVTALTRLPQLGVVSDENHGFWLPARPGVPAKPGGSEFVACQNPV